MMRQVGLVFVALLVVQVHCKRGYIITAPKALLHGTTEKLCITPLNNPAPLPVKVDVEIALEDAGREKMKFSSDYQMTSKDHCIELEIPENANPYQYDRNRATLKVIGVSFAQDPAIQIISEEHTIYMIEDKPSIFIQTDKAVYKPGQTVKFRTLSVRGSEILPFVSMVNYVFIENPSGVRLKQWLNVTTNTGLAEFEMPLSEEPVLGQWKIKVGQGKYTEEQYFDVDEYVLPKYEVIIKPPPFIVINDETIEIEVCGRYTYGQPVKGEAKAKVCIPGRSYYYYGNEKRPCVRTDKKVADGDGCAKFIVESEDLHLTSSNYSLWNTNLQVEAEFTEVDTGVTLNGTHESTIISKNPFNLEIQTPKNFKPGVPFYGKVIVTNPDGSPATGKLVTLKVNTNNGDIFNKNFTSESGVIEFSLPNVAIDTTRMTVEAIGPGFTQPYSYSSRYTHAMYNPRESAFIRPWYSPSGSFLQLEPVKQTLPVDSDYEFTVYYTTKETQQVQLFYKVISLGDILLSDSTERELTPEYEVKPLPPKKTTAKPTTLPPTTVPQPPPEVEDVFSEGELVTKNEEDDLIRIPEYDVWPWFPEIIEHDVDIEEPGSYGEMKLTLYITNNMAPKSKLLIYYVREDGEIIADSISFKVQKKFKNEVNVKFKEDETLPGAATQLEVTASPGSLCALGVVDKSVHLLRTGNQLTKSKVFNVLNQYDLSNSYFNMGRNTHCDKAENIDDIPVPAPRDVEKRSVVELLRKKKSIWPGHYYGGGYSNFDDALEAFENSNLIVMTSAVLETRPCTRYYPRGRAYYKMSRGPAGSVGGLVPLVLDSVQESQPAPAVEFDDVDDSNSVEDVVFEPLVEIRTYFPETWLWMLSDIGETGKSTIDVEVPHTITEWIGSGFCTSFEHGVGVSETTHLTAFQPFFLSYTLPYSVIRGEKVPVLVTVFNYVSQCLTIDLTIELTEDFEMLEDNAVKRVCVCGSESRTISYYIIPSILGEIPITVLGESVAADDVVEICGNDAIMSDRVGVRDALSDKLLVEPEGIEEEYTFSLFFCPKDELFEEIIALPIPDNVVEGSARGVVSVIGDLMGPTLSGLDKLVKVPYGCGEQNMVSFSPNIFVLQYLLKTEQATEDIKANAKANMLIGYQRELTYRHRDGSYSAFGERDTEGSTWLTAFVVKSFAQASQYIDIDQDDLHISLNWFEEQQNQTSGCFIKRGSVHNKRLKGGVSDETSLTAFVLIAMLEGGVSKEDPSVVLALQCLESKLDDITEVYPIAILSYALALAESERTEYIMNKLDEVATDTDGLVHWTSGETSEEIPYWRWYYTAPSADVEMTSYALLAKLTVADNRDSEEMESDEDLDSDTLGEVLPIVRWLTKQRNAYGGFSSTQDTILALQALAMYAGVVYRDGIDMYVDIQANDLVKRFSVNQHNKLVLQRVEIPLLPDDVILSAGGDGCALMQANVKYNVPESPAPPKFSLQVDITPLTLSDEAKPGQSDGCAGDKNIQICATYLEGSSNMAVIEAKMVSGYYPSKVSLKNAHKATESMARFDIDGSKTIFYFDEINTETVCFNFVMEHIVKVEDVKPAWVSVYDYYDTDTSAIVTYDVCQPAKIIQPPEDVTEPECPKCQGDLPDNFDELVCDNMIFKAKVHGKNVKMTESFSVAGELVHDEAINRVFTPILPESCACKPLDVVTDLKVLVITDPYKVIVTDKEEVIDADESTYFITWDTTHRKRIQKAYGKCNI